MVIIDVPYRMLTHQGVDGCATDCVHNQYVTSVSSRHVSDMFSNVFSLLVRY